MNAQSYTSSQKGQLLEDAAEQRVSAASDKFGAGQPRSTRLHPDARSHRGAWHVLIAIGGIALLAWTYLTWSYIEDDGFIHLEYARSVASGAGFSFDGHAVFADSSPLWIGMLAGLGLVLGDWLLASKLLSVVAFVLSVWCASTLCRRVLGEGRMAAAITALVMFSPFVVRWAVSGMEATLAMGLILWMLRMAFDLPQLSRARLLGTFALMGWVVLVRFEAALLVALLGGWLVHVRRPRTAGDWGLFVACGLLAAAPMLLWMAYAHSELGAIVPTTSAAKRIGQALSVGTLMQVGSRAVKTLVFGYPVVIVGAFWLAWRALRARSSGEELWGVVREAKAGNAIVLLGLWPLLLSVFYLLNRTNLQTRYAMLVGTPVLIGLGYVTQRVRGDWRELRALLAVAAALVLVENVAIVGPQVMRKAELTAAWRTELTEIGRRLPEDTPVAIYGIGQFAFELPHPVVDIGALVMPGGLAHIDDPAAMWRWAVSVGARCAVAGETPPESFEVVYTGTLPDAGWLPGPPRAYGLHCLPGTVTRAPTAKH